MIAAAAGRHELKSISSASVNSALCDLGQGCKGDCDEVDDSLGCAVCVAVECGLVAEMGVDQSEVGLGAHVEHNFAGHAHLFRLVSTMHWMPMRRWSPEIIMNQAEGSLRSKPRIGNARHGAAAKVRRIHLASLEAVASFVRLLWPDGT